MIPHQIAMFERQVEILRDALLGSFMVVALKTGNDGDRSEYDRLMSHFMQNPAFVNGLQELNDKFYGEASS